MKRAALVSEDGVFRYWLTREWSPDLGQKPRRLCFVMLNPSTADASEDDPTIRKCIGFARLAGFNMIDRAVVRAGGALMNALLTETLEARLERAHPGAKVFATSALGPTQAWTVLLADGRRFSSTSKREVIYQAEQLGAVRP